MSAIVNSHQPQQVALQYQSPYEACIYGSITGAEAFQPVFDRLTLRTDMGATSIHIHEIIFQARNLPTLGYGASDESSTLVCRRDLLSKDGGWILSTRGKPEPLRLHPNAIVRPAVYSKAHGDIHGFASIMGFELKSETFKRGFVFGKGIVTIFIYQLDVINPQTRNPQAAPPETAWMIEARTPPTTGILTESTDALAEVKGLLRGLVDLDRSNYMAHV